MEQKILEPTAEQIKAALRLCAVDEPAGKYPCEKCYLYPLSQDGRMSTGRTCFEHLVLDTCQLIDRLNDFDQTQSKIALERCQRAEARLALREHELHGYQDTIVPELKAQLAASQRETRAAVEDIEKMMRICEKGSCHFCANGDCTESPYCSPKWRGPQEAMKGAAE